MRILVVSNLYPPETRGGYEVECMGVVDHLRRCHEVEVLTSTEGSADPDERGIHRTLPFVSDRRTPSLLAPAHAVRAVKVTRTVLTRFRPELVFVFNGASIPQSALLEMARHDLPLAVRVCEQWFGRLYEGDRFLRHLIPGETGLRGLWARAMRTINRIDPRLRLDPARPTRWAVSWGSKFLRDTVVVPRWFDVVYETSYVPANPRVPQFAAVVPRAADGEPVVFFAGRLGVEKGADVALRAVAELRDRHGIAVRLVLAGPGTAADRARLSRLAVELELADRVELPGKLEFPTMLETLATSAVWVVPSVWDEPAGMVAQEAAAARVPAVLSRVGGLPEMLREGDEALFFARADHEGCAAALALTIADPGAAAERVERAHRRVVEHAWARYLASTDAFVEAASRALTGSAPQR